MSSTNLKIKPVELLVPVERIEKSILLIRKQKVMLDANLAELYGVETKALVQAVKRNLVSKSVVCIQVGGSNTTSLLRSLKN